MYEENRTGFILKDILLQIILVVVFVFLLLWLFPTKGYVNEKLENGLDPLYSQIFNDNLTAMKEAAKSYYTTSRLPKKVGDKVSMTLGEMLDKKLLTAFVDSNNKQCNLTGSYVEITKMDDEYMMKVNLNCSDKSDYIIVYLGCYNYCDSNLCEKQETTTTTKPVTTPTKKPSTGNNNNNNTGNNNNNNVTTTVTKYKYQLTTGSYSNWSNWSDWSETKVTSNNYRDVETKTDKQLVLLGHKYLDVDYETDKNSYNAVKSLVCPTGFVRYSDDDDKCVSVSNKYLPTASCKSGYTLNAAGTACVQNGSSTTSTTTNALTKVEYSCPYGGTLNGKECIISSSAKNIASPVATGEYTYSAWSTPVEKEFTSAQVSNETTKYTYVTTRVELECNNSCKRVTKMVYKVSTRKATPVYKCPSGYNWSSDGKSCEKTTSATSGYAAKETSVSYCANGSTPVNGKCTTTTTTTAKSVAPTMSCKKGEYDSKTQLCAVTGTYEWSCPSDKDGYVSGKKCITEVKQAYCETGTLVTYKGEQKCRVADKKYVTTTLYRYRTRTYIPTTDIKYSTSNNDKTLINKGYKLVGQETSVVTKS